MDIITNNLGKTVIATIIFTGIISILSLITITTSTGTYTGYRNIIAANVNDNSNNYDDYNDITEVITVINSSTPQISYNTSQPILTTYSRVILDDYFIVTLNNNEYIASSIATFKIREITLDDENVTYLYNIDDKSIEFTQNGTYKVTAYIYDAVNKETSVKINLPVEKKI